MDPAAYAETVVQLVNAPLPSLDALVAFLAHRRWLAERATRADLGPLRALQAELAAIVEASAAGDGAAVVRLVNTALDHHPVRPLVSGHDDASWHLHVSDDDAPVREVMAAEAAFGLALLVTDLGPLRLGRCGAPGCDRAYLDTSANRSRRFCSSRCGSRVNVAAHRRRLAGLEEAVTPPQ